MGWRTLLITTNLRHAQVVIARLQASGFEVVLHESGSRDSAVLNIMDGWEYRVLVPALDHQRAAALLRQFDPDVDTDSRSSE
jgi:hypothetical protein